MLVRKLKRLKQDAGNTATARLRAPRSNCCDERTFVLELSSSVLLHSKFPKKYEETAMGDTTKETCSLRKLSGGSERTMCNAAFNHTKQEVTLVFQNINVSTKLNSILTFIILIVSFQSAFADITAAPRFLKQPTFNGGYVKHGDIGTLHCSALGTPSPEFQWLKDGKPLDDFRKNPKLRITVNSDSSGAYQCVARNTAGAIFSEKTQLTVAYILPLEEINNISLVVSSGRAALVQPPLINSNPKATANWEKLGTDFLPDQKFITTMGNALVILNAEKTDSGVYKVVFSNSQTGRQEIGGFAEIVVEDDELNESENPVIVVAPSNSTFQKEDAQAMLDCVANASPLQDLQIDWSKDGIPISKSAVDHFPYFLNKPLALLDINPSHSGLYQCKASLKSQPDKYIVAEAYVTVHIKPSIVRGPEPETVSELGEQIVLSCEVEGTPTPEVSWYRNSVIVGNDPDDRYQRLENGSLKISKLITEDSGIFQCVAENAAGYTSANTWLHIKSSAPYFLNPPKNLTVLDGVDAQFPCEVSGSPKPTTSWALNGTIPIHSAGRSQILDSGAFVLKSVEPRDVGFYSCSRTNSAGTVSASAFLTILVRTQIIRPPADTKVILSNTAELQCKVSHDPLVPYEVSWFFQGKKLGEGDSRRFQALSDGTLRISLARTSDVGSYTCQVISAGGNDTRSARLDVLELPYAPTSVHATILNSTKLAVNVSWSKAFDGNSPLTMYIVQMQTIASIVGVPDESQDKAGDSANQPLEPLAPWVTAANNISTDERFVILKNLKPSSNYRFRVIAANGVGEGNPSSPTGLITLPSEPPSSPPVGVVGAPRSSTSIMLQWQPPFEEDRNGDLLGFVVRYKLAGYSTSPWAYENTTNPAHHNILLEDLIIWKTYEIQVAAYNEKGVGVYSEPIRLRTKEGVPEGIPSNVRVFSLNSTAIEVFWKPPPQQTINGINQGYKVEVWNGSPGLPKTLAQSISIPPSLIDPWAEQKSIIVGLNKYTWYNVTCLCFTAVGNGKRSDYIEIITHQDVPDEVESLKFDDVLDSSLRVLWKPPKNSNGVLLGYTITYFAKDSNNEVVIKNFSSDVLTYLASGLHPITTYAFQIYAKTSVGAGPSVSATIQSGIPPVLPGPPERLAVSNIDATSVVLQFTPGFDGNTSITKWTVLASTKRRNESSWFVVDDVSDPDATNLVVRKLVPFTEYRLCLVATNVVGSSPSSEPTKYFQTIQAPPSHPPYNVTARALNSNSLRVRWTPLQQFEWYGIPRGYNISFRPTLVETETSENETKKFQWRILEDHNANSFVLENLEEFTEYQVFVQAFNDVGSSGKSSISTERTRESVPSVGPVIVVANSTSSTTIVVKWSEIPAEHRNGILEGFKIRFGAKNVPFQTKTIEGNSTFIATLSELKKFTTYTIQCLAYTRIGEGSLSLPPISVTTLDDVPGMPSNVSFPDVSTTTARIIWDVPLEPNGQILAYLVSYRQNKTGDGSISKELPPTDRTLKAFNLKHETFYVFTVAAQTREGWGQPANAVVFTTNKREAPQAPSSPRVSLSQIQACQITFSWTPGSDGFAPLRFYTVQISDDDSHWKTVPDKVDPFANTYTVTGLKPFTSYKFRLQATNDIGASGWSPSSNETFTLSDAPGARPENVEVTPYSKTAVTVQWQPLALLLFNGDTRNPGYRVEYCVVSAYAVPQSTDCPSVKKAGINSTSVSLENLEPDRIYEIKVFAYNDAGLGPSSVPFSVYVGEAVPSGPPREVKANALSSTEIGVTWEPPLENQQNGDLLGYKIFYQSEIKGTPEELEVVPVSTTSYVLMDLSKYRDYRIQISAFNPAGSSPRSESLCVRTLEDVPGPPGPISFSAITMTSLNVSFKEPKNKNGRIRGYQITYETAVNDSNLSKHIQETVSETYLSIKGLRELVTYRFSIRAETIIGLGPPTISNITTGPQSGSPSPPSDVRIQTTHTSATLQWVNGESGVSPLNGYLIEAQESDGSDWIIIANLNNGPQQTYTISFQNLLPSKHYQFRLFSRNRAGISKPVAVAQAVATPSKMYLEYKPKLPFYREVWFLVMLAAATVIIIILVVAILCVKSKAYKYKQEAAKSIQDDRISMDDGGFATFELRQSKRGTLCKNTLTRKGGNTLKMAAKTKLPPRPSPASVTYSDDESAKGYDDQCDSSSLTEKPSEISSTDSQATDSDRESSKSEPHSFVNHYANVNDTFRHSWKRQKPHTHVKPPSYSDSEPEGSLAVSLNGGQIIMNNLAGSRAPLPGFSSFV